MKRVLYKARIHLLIAGIAAFLFGVAVLIKPGYTLLFVVRLFAGYMIIKGLLLSAGALRTCREEKYWQFLLWHGILNVMTGIIAVEYPRLTWIILGFIVSINLLVSGILQVLIARQIHRATKKQGWMIFSGVIVAIAGVYVYLMQGVSALMILYFIAIAALILSIFFISLSVQAFGYNK